MKIFGFEIRKFEKTTTTINAVETWIVEWTSINDSGLFICTKSNHQAFTSKKDADFYAKELKAARKLLGDKGVSLSVYKQKTHTNA